MSGIFGGGGSSRTTVQPAPLTPEQTALTGLQVQLAQKQLDNINALAPYQQELLTSATSTLKSQTDYQTALDKAITPEDQAAAAAEQFKQARTLGPIQTELAQLQLDAIKQGGRATDQQKSDIAAATDAAISAGTGDINTQMQRGIGLISDELANARGLRLSDSPIGSEAALLTRAGNDQVSSLIKNLRANQASSVLNYPLAAQGLISGINTNASNINAAATNFQDQLRQQAYQNRMMMMGSAGNTGLGLASIGSNMSALNMPRGQTTDIAYTSPFGQTLGGIGAFASGASAAAPYILKMFP